jgi:WD40 repeat protein
LYYPFISSRAAAIFCAANPSVSSQAADDFFAGQAANWPHFSIDGRRVVTASMDSTARARDAVKGIAIQTFRHNYWVWNAAFSQDGVRVVTACSDGRRKYLDLDACHPPSIWARLSAALRFGNFFALFRTASRS